MDLSRLALLALVAVSAAQAPGAAQTTEDLRFSTADPGGFFSVASRHDRVAAGAPRADHAGTESGTAYVFDASTAQQLVRFDALDAEAFDWFGAAIALGDDVALVGAPRHNEFDFMADTGAAYVFDATTGQQLHDFTPTDLAGGRRFGTSVSLSGDLAAIGAEGFAGAVYLFDVAAGQELRKLTATDGVHGDRLGGSVSISGERVVAGARFADSRVGAAYVFEASAGWGDLKLQPADGAVGDAFGEAVAVNGDWVVIGAPGHEGPGGENSGAVYVFDGATGLQLMKLVPSDGAAHDRFGSSVALHGTKVVVGAPRSDTLAGDAGAAYVFDLTTGAELEKLVASDATADDFAGWSVSIWGEDVALVGSRLGYIFDLDFTFSTCTPSSGNSVSSTGALLVSTGGFGTAVATFSVVGVPDSFGLLAAGTMSSNVPLGCGSLCIGGSLVRGPVVVASGNQVVDMPFDMSQPGLVHVQYFYRDTGGCAAGFDLSNALTN